MELDGAVKAAHEVLARADADAAYWMQQYKRCVEYIHNWVEASPLDEEESAPRYRLLQQTLQNTRHGLDYAVRTASDARQELANARQFYLAARTITPVSALHVAPASPSIPTVSTESSPAPFRIRPTPAASSSVQPVRTLETAPPAAVRRSLSVGSDVGSPVPPEIRRSTIPSVTVKRVGRETVYLVPAKRARYPRAFKWDDNLMHHFPKDFTIPVCPLSTMWEYWVCGDPIAKYPPFRILVAPELEDVKTRRMLSSLRFVMLEIEARVLEHGAWLDKPSPRDAAAMLETVKESIAARPAAKRGELHPVEQLQWTSLGRILRDQKKMIGEDEENEEEEE
ncbi:hypothetical protein F441_21144 [Phytophthora nicotianae CJ01A1]|uniref:Uncharacterized protein n=2 Tax=Phytophthora nicotianae TaxID=4792 RepID=W2VTJ7_PHYNI|nr:hypothetical protein L916_20537 [Phytophthora nicotianae]ETP01647.1 hypothetical protein F441_21144 [Phytophthora nicotianae CJ01A1]